MGWTEEIELPPSFVILALSVPALAQQRQNAQGQTTRAIRRVPPGLLVDAGVRVRVPLIGGCIIGDVHLKQNVKRLPRSAFEPVWLRLTPTDKRTQEPHLDQAINSTLTLLDDAMPVSKWFLLVLGWTRTQHLAPLFGDYFIERRA